ncbi:hypothetical protein EBZ80_01260 [bacterium]|nr:hypothetical protein [bacterium]
MRVETLIENDSRRFVFHVSDIHIRLFSRHEEYEGVFRELCAFVADHPRRGDAVIVITGDVFHTKVELTPECTILCYSLLKRLGGLAPTIVIAGNHDALLNNRARTDSLTSILWERPVPNLWFLKESGYYRVGTVVFGVNSLLDAETAWIAPPRGLPAAWEGLTLVALYHGSLLGWKNLLGYTSEFSEKTVEEFEGYDFVMLGDIHRHQYMDKARRVAYAGSLISQNFGETDNDHGVLCWDLDSGASVLHRLPNPFAFKEAVLDAAGTIEVLYDDGPCFRWEDTDDLRRALPARASLRVVMTDDEDANRDFLYHLARARPDVRIQKRTDRPAVSAASAQTAATIDSCGSEEKWIREYVFGCEGGDPVLAEEMIGELLEYYHKHVKPEKKTAALSWEIRRLRFSHMFGYGAGNEIDVSRLTPSTITGIFGKNSAGKSTLIDIITFLLFGRITRSSHGNSIPREIIHSLEKRSTGELEFVVGGRGYKVVKECTRQKDDRIRVVEHLYQRNGDDWVDLSEEHRKKTDRVIESLLGTYESFVFTSVCLQQKERPFRELTQKDRKDFLYSLLGLDRFDALRKEKDEEVKALRAEEKVYTGRMGDGSRAALREELERLETGRSRERLAEEQRRQEELRARAEDMIRGLEPCALTGSDELAGREKDLRDRLRRVETEIAELERVRDRLSRTTDEAALRAERDRLAGFESDGEIPEEAQAWIHRSEKEWQGFYAEYRDFLDHAAEIREAWEAVKQAAEEETGRLQAALEPENRDGRVAVSLKEWDALRNTIEDVRAEKTALERVLTTPPQELPPEIEGLAENLRRRVSAWSGQRTATAYLEKEVKKSRKTRFNPSCAECLSNPLFTERKKLELELEMAVAHTHRMIGEIQESIKSLRRAWPSAFPDNDDSPETMLEWVETELRHDRRSRTEHQKRQRQTRERLDEIHETIRRYEDSRRHHHNRELRAAIRTLQESLRCHPARVRYDRLFELMAAEKTVEFMKDFWTAEPGFREYVRSGAGARRRELDALLNRLEKDRERAGSVAERLVALYEERGSATALRERLETDREILARNEAILRDRDDCLRQERESRALAGELTEAIIRQERDREALLLRLRDWETAAAEADRLRREIRKTETFLRCIDRDGLPLFLLSMHLPRMEDEINSILGEFLHDRPMRLRVQERAVVIGLRQPGGALSAYLGGMEAFITDLALKMVFAKYSLLPRSNFFIIDEGVSVLDQERVAGIATLFGFLAGLSDHTFLISHLPTIKDFVTDAIEVEKDDKGYSRLFTG